MSTIDAVTSQIYFWKHIFTVTGSKCKAVTVYGTKWVIKHNCFQLSIIIFSFMFDKSDDVIDDDDSLDRVKLRNSNFQQLV